MKPVGFGTYVFISTNVCRNNITSFTTNYVNLSFAPHHWSNI